MNSKAPELIGDTWLQTSNSRLGIADFRGRFLLLDFWTLCCVNCHHVLAELRPIEKKFAEVLTVVGVHSPKFEHEKLPESVLAAISRHEIEHPVLNDPNMTTWKAYGVRAWPTLVLVDPLGEIVATYSGEGHSHAIEALLTKLVPKYEQSGNLSRGKGFYQAIPKTDEFLMQPGKITAIPPRYRELLGGGDLLVSNSGGHDLVAIHSSNPNQPLLRIGSGRRGSRDGSFDEAAFAEPYGAKFLDEDMALKTGFDLIVADTANHLIRAINLESKTITKIAGTGNQWMQKDETEGPALQTNISTPWDVEVIDGQLLIAMAGEHRIWKYDFATKSLGIFAGTTNEGLVDGPLLEAWFAQPSALAKAVNKTSGLWVIDAETSALRLIEGDKIVSVIGKGLFDFGHVDGPSSTALLQHPLGVIEAPDGSVLIADTYNRAIRKFSPATNQVATIARDLAEPSDLELVETETGPKLAVVEAAANRITLIPISNDIFFQGEAMRTSRPALEVAPGQVELDVVFSAPPGQKLDDRYGPSTYLVVSATPKDLLVEGSGNSVELGRVLKISADISEGVLHVAAKGASCDESLEGAQCHIHQQDWGIPIKISPTGTSDIRLVLSGN